MASTKDHALERKWFMDHFSRDLLEKMVHQLQEDLVKQKKVDIIWPKLKFNMFPNGNIVWNIQKILLDDFDSWDRNLELILLKEKMGLVQFFRLSCKDENILHPLFFIEEVLYYGTFQRNDCIMLDDYSMFFI